MDRQPEALFVIDDKQRIVEWSNAAAVTLGIGAEAALGQPCYEVVLGRDPFGKAVCRLNCPAFKALQSGHSAGRCTLLLYQGSGQRRRFICELAALPYPPGSALATLVERPQESSPTTAFDTAHDLAFLTSLTASLSWDHLDQSLEQALKWLGEATHAEGAELFLVEPASHDMLLAAYTGPFRSAFSQIARFHPGQGFPGLVEANRQPILTTGLLEDPRYLRTMVKERGFQSYVCVPLLSGSGYFMGSLHVTARRPDLDTERAFRILTWASRPLSNILEVGLLHYRLAVGATSKVAPASAEEGFDDLLKAVLHQMVTIGHATGGALFLYERDTQGLVRRVVDGELGTMVCPDPGLANGQPCPVLMSGQSIALYGSRHLWPQVCKKNISIHGGLVYCLPLTTAGETVGVIQLGYSPQAPSPSNQVSPLAPERRRAGSPLDQAGVGEPPSSGTSSDPSGQVDGGGGKTGRPVTGFGHALL